MAWRGLGEWMLVCALGLWSELEGTLGTTIYVI